MSTIATTNLKHPSSAVNNMVLSSNGNVTAATKFIGSGLDHIVTQSFSSVSSVSLNNCFSSSYENYRIIFSISAQSAANDINVRMRANGSDTSTSTYNWAYSRGGRTTLADGGSTSGATSWIPFSGTNAYLSQLTLEIFRANVSGQAGFISHSFSYDGGYLVSFRGGVCTQATAHDGITFISTSGTITGTVRVYGYENT